MQKISATISQDAIQVNFPFLFHFKCYDNVNYAYTMKKKKTNVNIFFFISIITFIKMVDCFRLKGNVSFLVHLHVLSDIWMKYWLQFSFCNKNYKNNTCMLQTRILRGNKSSSILCLYLSLHRLSRSSACKSIAQSNRSSAADLSTLEVNLNRSAFLII